MTRESKLKTPEWILEGYGNKAEWEKAKGIKNKKPDRKTYKVKQCPKCGSNKINVVLSGSEEEEGGGNEWECKECKWAGTNIAEKEVNEDEFLKYAEENGEGKK